MRTGPRRPVAGPGEATDDGFTLVEVIVAMVLLSAVMTATLAVFVSSMRTTVDDDRRSNAVTVAGQQMQLARSVYPKYSASTGSALVRGRTSTAVAAAWTKAPTWFQNSTTQTNASDPTATTSSTPLLPLSTTVTVDGVAYTAATYIGTCWRSVASSTTPCTSTVSGVQLFRVSVVVTWSAGAGSSCSGAACSTTLTTLVDPSSDVTYYSAGS